MIRPGHAVADRFYLWRSDKSYRKQATGSLKFNLDCSALQRGARSDDVRTTYNRAISAMMRRVIQQKWRNKQKTLMLIDFITRFKIIQVQSQWKDKA
jgi:hypothetical protein